MKELIEQLIEETTTLSTQLYDIRDTLYQLQESYLEFINEISEPVVVTYEDRED